MPRLTFDLGSVWSWGFVGGAVLVLTPVTNPVLRRVLLAGVNVAFLVLVTGPIGGLGCAAFAVLLHLVARLQSPGARLGGTFAVGTLLAALFVLHKTGGAGVPASAALRPILSAIGFSYVALRSVELLRAGAEEQVEGGVAGVLDTVSYLLPFHMLAAGPIQGYADFRRQAGPPPRLGPAEVLDAIERITSGLFKKFVLARALELTCLTGFRAPGLYTLLEIQVYYVWIYLDFSAYTDLAVGFGRLLGVATPENFDRPFGARNIIVYWDRWHMTLSRFIRRNLFIPIQLGLMRRSLGERPLLAASVAFSISFVACGLWHGLSLRFLVWGALHAGALVVCNLYKQVLTSRLGARDVPRYLANPLIRGVSTVLTFEFVAFSLAFIVHPATALLR